MAKYQTTGIKCPICGSMNVRIETRSSGTKAHSNYYRTGVKNSWFIPAGRKTYKSKRQYQGVYTCTNCGNVWTNGSQVSGFIWKCIGVFTLVVVYIGLIGALLDKSTGLSSDIAYIVILVAMTVPIVRWIYKKFIKAKR